MNESSEEHLRKRVSYLEMILVLLFGCVAGQNSSIDKVRAIIIGSSRKYGGFNENDMAAVNSELEKFYKEESDTRSKAETTH